MIKIHKLGSQYLRNLQYKPSVEVKGPSGLYLSRIRHEFKDIADIRAIGHRDWQLTRKRPFRVKRELVKHTVFTADY